MLQDEIVETEAVPNPEPITPKKQIVLTQSFKDLIVKRCTEELISPTKLAAEHGIDPESVRRWVKKSGAVLPTKYNHELQPSSDKKTDATPELPEKSNTEVIIQCGI